MLGVYLAYRKNERIILKWSLIIFVTIYGSLIDLSPGNDGYKHLNNVQTYYGDLSFEQFYQDTENMFLLKANEYAQEDPYIHILSYLCGTILGLPYLFFVIVGFVYGYFYIGSLFELFSYFPKIKSSRIFFFIALLFILWESVEGVNSVRTWTGMWVLFYACLKYYRTKKRKYLFLMFVPPMIHIGYLAMAIPTYIVLMFGNKKRVYSIVFFASFFMQFGGQVAILNSLSKTEVGQNKVEGYYVEEQTGVEGTLTKYSKSNWYMKLVRAGLHNYAVYGLAFVLIIVGVYFKRMPDYVSKIFSIGLLTIALSNSTWFLYALHNRSAKVGTTFILAGLILVWQHGVFSGLKKRTEALVKFFFLIALLVCFPFFVYKVSTLMQFMSVFLISIPALPWVLREANLSIRDAIGLVLGIK